MRECSGSHHLQSQEHHINTYLSSSEAAALLGIDEHELYRKSSAMGGPLPCLPAGESYVYRRIDVEDYRDGRLQGAKPLSSEQEISLHSSGEFFAESVVSETTGIIKSVLLCGNASLNGYSIPSRAFGGSEGVKRLYEDKPVFLDHAPRGKELARSVREMAGMIVTAYLRNGKPYGDIDTESYPEGRTLLKLAKARPRGLGMSHIAEYRMSRDRQSVESIDRVFSVDCVVRPATTSTFFERTDKATEPTAEPEPLFIAHTARWL